MTEHETRVPFSERPLVKFLTLEYPMGPMQFIIMIIVASVLVRSLLMALLYVLLSLAFLIPEMYRDGFVDLMTTTVQIIYYIIQAWVSFCFICARLDDAKIPRHGVIAGLIAVAVLGFLCMAFIPGAYIWVIWTDIAVGLSLTVFLLLAPSRLYSDMTPQDRARKIEQDRLKSPQ